MRERVRKHTREHEPLASSPHRTHARARADGYQEHGVEKTYHLKSAPLETDQRRMVFLVRDTILNIKAVAAQVKYNQQRREKMVRVRVRALACTHARMYACMHTRIRACTHARMHAYASTRILSYTLSHTHNIHRST